MLEFLFGHETGKSSILGPDLVCYASVRDRSRIRSGGYGHEVIVLWIRLSWQSRSGPTQVPANQRIQLQICLALVSLLTTTRDTFEGASNLQQRQFSPRAHTKLFRFRSLDLTYVSSISRCSRKRPMPECILRLLLGIVPIQPRLHLRTLPSTWEFAIDLLP